MMRFRRETATPCLTKPRLVMLAGASALLGIVLLAGAAEATEVKYPASAPRITLQVPDKWAVSTDAPGLFLTSPEKDANVLVGIVPGNEKAVEAWAKDARAKLVAAGTKFDKSKPTRTLVAKAAPNQLTIGPNAFSGAPSVGGHFGSAGPTGGVDSKGAAAPASAAPKPFKVVQTFGSTLNGKPVDIEIYLYKIGTGGFVLIEQQTGPTDERGVAIQRSLEILK